MYFSAIVILDLFLGAGLVAVFADFVMFKWRHKNIKLPPGPPLDPFIGGLRFMPLLDQWVVFNEWTKKWGMRPFVAYISQI